MGGVWGRGSYRAVGTGLAKPRATIIASWRAGRTWRICSFVRVGFTRFVSRITKRSRSGSIQSDVPVKPVCPKLLAEKYWPADEVGGVGTSHPRVRAESPIFILVANSRTVARDTIR